MFPAAIDSPYRADWCERTTEISDSGPIVAAQRISIGTCAGGGNAILSRLEKVLPVKLRPLSKFLRGRDLGPGPLRSIVIIPGRAERTQWPNISAWMIGH